MDGLIIKNAIILAAGKSNRFAPFTYERPKGLFRVKGEILIERQIEQLIEAGITEIYVVVGYMKEKFFYKGSVGDDDSFFFLSAYRNLVRFIDSALLSYRK